MSVAQVSDDRACRSRRQLQMLCAEGVERRDIEMLKQSVSRRLESSLRFIEPRDRANLQRRQFNIARRDQLCRSDALKLADGLLAVEFRHAKLARRDVCVSDAGGAIINNEAGKIIIGAAFEQSRLDDGAGRDNARDFAVDQSFAGRRHLVADGDLVAALDELGEMAFERTHGNARQRMRVAFAEPLARQHDAEFARQRLRVFVKGFVEIADLKQQDHAGIAALDLQVLSAQRRAHK